MRRYCERSFLAAIRANLPIRLHGALAIATCGLQRRATIRTNREIVARAFSALRALLFAVHKKLGHGAAHDQINEKTQHLPEEYEERPEQTVAAAFLRVIINVECHQNPRRPAHRDKTDNYPIGTVKLRNGPKEKREQRGKEQHEKEQREHTVIFLRRSGKSLHLSDLQ